MKFLNRKSLLLSFALLLLVLGACSKSQKDPLPIHETFTIDSTETNEKRTINVYTPPQYNDDQATHFPVIYMPDGGILEDFPHVANTIDAAIRAGEMKPVVLVGVENTVRRRDMTPPTEVAEDRKVAPVVGGSAALRAFYTNELIPYVTSHYRVTDDSGIIGESLAGLFIMEFFFLQPDLFDKYIALDPSLWWNDHDYVRRAAALVQEHPKMNVDLYMASSNAKDIFVHTESLAMIFEGAGPSGLRWEYEPRPDLRHTNIYRTLSPKILRKFYPPSGVTTK